VAFADRGAWLADPAYFDVPLTGLLSTGFVMDWLIKAGQEVSSNVALPDYPVLRGAATYPRPLRR